MYTKKNQILTSLGNLANYIDNFDVYNSSILSKLSNPGVKKTTYQILVHQYRPDMIAKDFYGSESYLGLLMLQCGIGLESYTKGRTLELIPKEELDGILRTI